MEPEAVRRRWGVWLTAATIDVLIHFAGVSSTEVLSQVFVSSAVLVGAIGLAGFYPRLVDDTSRLAKASLGIALLTAAGMAIHALLSVVSVALPTFDVLNAESTASIAVIAVPGLLAMVVFLLFGGSVLRTAAATRSVGIPLSAEGVVMALIVFGPTDALPRGVYLVGAEVVHASLFLAIGTTLRGSLPPAKPGKLSPA